MKKRVIILGAGISGLSAAWYLSKTQNPPDVCLLEKSARVGGWMRTDHTTGFHFEKGPRTFKVARCPSTMRLVSELGLSGEILCSGARSHHRYLWLDDALHRFPTHPLAFLFSPLTKGFIPALLTEWKRPVRCGDETVWEFVLRRFNHDVARLFFDPMVVGIFGGDIRKISVRACFPTLKKWEEEFGSVTKGFYHRMREKRREPQFSAHVQGVPLSAIFSFRNGMEQLPQSIAGQIPASVHCNTEVKGFQQEKDQVIVTTENQRYVADALFCALPLYETGLLLEPHVPEVSNYFFKIHSEGIAVVNLGYDADVLPVQGFGYLTPTYAGEDILGCVFDSSIFSAHNTRAQETRLTVKMADNGRTEDSHVEAALQGIRRHLGISRMPKAVHFQCAQRAIPQYGVGHLEKMAGIKKQLQSALPHCHFLGNYLQGVSVEACIARAKEAVQEWESIR